MTCIECPRTDADPKFQFSGDRRHQGPAYWSDRGPLCGPECSTKHYLRRIADGTFDPRPSFPK